MHVYHSPDSRAIDLLPETFPASVLAIGNFDGVHCGHQSVLAAVRERAAALGAQSVAVTFEPHPVRVLRPELAPRLITPLRKKLELLAAQNIDATVVIPFTQAFSELSAEQFAAGILHNRLQALEVYEGDNFRFGHGATAGTAELRQLGESLGFKVLSHPALICRGMQVSSSAIRKLIAAGNVGTARALLGRPFSIESTQVRDRGIGTRLTVPTINLAQYSELVPKDGVYITRLKIGSGAQAESFDAVTNAGNRPTFGSDSYAIESHLLNFDPSGHPVEITPETPLELTFLKRVRDEKRFDSPEALKAQILRDVKQAQRFFALEKTLRKSTGTRT
jgi:riboflavin kinase/FMN adenylyltransferase